MRSLLRVRRLQFMRSLQFMHSLLRVRRLQFIRSLRLARRALLVQRKKNKRRNAKGEQPPCNEHRLSARGKG